jgi:hypothetical protein
MKLGKMFWELALMATDDKELPKEHRIGEVLCSACKWYEGPNWKPNWGERYCHHPKIFRTGLVNTTWGCERWEANMKDEERPKCLKALENVVENGKAISNDWLVANIKETLVYIQKLQSDLYAANNIVSDYVDTSSTDKAKIAEQKKRIRNLLENANIMIEEYDELEKERDYWKEQLVLFGHHNLEELEKQWEERSQVNGSKV